MKRPKKKESFKLKEYDKDHNGLMSYTRDSIIDLLNEYALLTSKLFRKMHYNMSLSLYNYNSIKGSSIVTIENRKECIGFVSYSIDENDKRVMIHQLHIDKNHKRLGWGSKLVRYLFIKYSNYQFEVPYVISNNFESVVFWKSLGFIQPVHCSFVTYPTEIIPEEPLED